MIFLLSFILSYIHVEAVWRFLKKFFLYFLYKLKKIAVKLSRSGNKFFSSNLHFTLRRDNKIVSAHCDSTSASIARAFGAFSTSFPLLFSSTAISSCFSFFPAFFPEDFSRSIVEIGILAHLTETSVNQQHPFHQPFPRRSDAMARMRDCGR